MTKTEFILRYGEEKYKKMIDYNRENHRKHRNTDPEWEKNRSEKKYKKLKEKLKINLELKTNYDFNNNRRRQSRYVENGRIDLIENYDKALVDNFNGWHIHHKLELHPDGSIRFSSKSLKELNLYYHRPASELIWISAFEHNSIHHRQNI